MTELCIEHDQEVHTIKAMQSKHTFITFYLFAFFATSFTLFFLLPFWSFCNCLDLREVYINSLRELLFIICWLCSCDMGTARIWHNTYRTRPVDNNYEAVQIEQNCLASPICTKSSVCNSCGFFVSVPIHMRGDWSALHCRSRLKIIWLNMACIYSIHTRNIREAVWWVSSPWMPKGRLQEDGLSLVEQQVTSRLRCVSVISYSWFAIS